MFETASARCCPSVPAQRSCGPWRPPAQKLVSAHKGVSSRAPRSSSEAGVHTQGGLLQSPAVLITQTPGSPVRFLTQEHSFCRPLLCPRLRGFSQVLVAEEHRPSYSLPGCTILFSFCKKKDQAAVTLCHAGLPLGPQPPAITDALGKTEPTVGQHGP